MIPPLPEPWLRGPIPGVDSRIAPILYAFEQAREDLGHYTEGLTIGQIWATPYNLGSVGFHILHIAGSVDRLTTYLTGSQLSAEQMAFLASESRSFVTREELLTILANSLTRAEALVRTIDPASLAEAREVGRKRLPTTIIGLLTHIAEHTQRHVGQAITTAKVVGSPVPEEL